MSEVFFISDTHFGHRGIIEFSATKPFRPFATIEEHDEELVRRWNFVVGVKDTVWHLGDFCFGKRTLEIAARLNGNKKLVMGNHDMYPTGDYLRYFSRLAGVIEYKGLVLSHSPLHESQLARWRGNVHGHLHADRVMRVVKGDTYPDTPPQSEPDPRYVSVCCEQTDLAPVPFDWILNKGMEAD